MSDPEKVPQYALTVSTVESAATTVTVMPPALSNPPRVSREVAGRPGAGMLPWKVHVTPFTVPDRESLPWPGTVEAAVDPGARRAATMVPDNVAVVEPATHLAVAAPDGVTMNPHVPAVVEFSWNAPKKAR